VVDAEVDMSQPGYLVTSDLGAGDFRDVYQYLAKFFLLQAHNTNVKCLNFIQECFIYDISYS